MRTTALTICVLAIAIATVLHAWPDGLTGWAGVATVPDSSMEPTYQSGDLLLLRRQPVYEPGDVVAFDAPGARVVARVVDGNPVTGYVLRGDDQMMPYPTRPDGSVIIGRATTELLPAVGAVARTVDAVPTTLLAAALGAVTILWTPERLRRLQARRGTRRTDDGWRRPDRPSSVPLPTRPALHATPGAAGPTTDRYTARRTPVTGEHRHRSSGPTAPPARVHEVHRPPADGWAPAASWDGGDARTVWRAAPADEGRHTGVTAPDPGGSAPAPVDDAHPVEVTSIDDAPARSPADVGPRQDRAGPADERPEQVGPAEEPPEQIGPAEDRPEQVVPAEDRPEQVVPSPIPSRSGRSPWLVRAVAAVVAVAAVLWSFDVVQLMGTPTTVVVDTADTSATRLLELELVAVDDDAPADDPDATRSIRPEPVVGWLDVDGPATRGGAIETVGTVPVADSQLDRDEVDVLVATVRHTADPGAADPAAVLIDVDVRGAEAQGFDPDDALDRVPSDDGTSATVRIDLGTLERGLGRGVYQLVLTPSVELQRDPGERRSAAVPVVGESLVARVSFGTVGLGGAMATSVRAVSGPSESTPVTASVLGIDMRIAAARLVSLVVLGVLLALLGLVLWSAVRGRPWRRGAGEPRSTADAAQDPASAPRTVRVATMQELAAVAERHRREIQLRDGPGGHEACVEVDGRVYVHGAPPTGPGVTPPSVDVTPSGTGPELVRVATMRELAAVAERHRREIQLRDGPGGHEACVEVDGTLYVHGAPLTAGVGGETWPGAVTGGAAPAAPGPAQEPPVDVHGDAPTVVEGAAGTVTIVEWPAEEAEGAVERDGVAVGARAGSDDHDDDADDADLVVTIHLDDHVVVGDRPGGDATR